MLENTNYDDTVKTIKLAILQSQYDAGESVNEKQLQKSSVQNRTQEKTVKSYKMPNASVAIIGTCIREFVDTISLHKVYL